MQTIDFTQLGIVTAARYLSNMRRPQRRERIKSSVARAITQGLEALECSQGPKTAQFEAFQRCKAWSGSDWAEAGRRLATDSLSALLPADKTYADHNQAEMPTPALAVRIALAAISAGIDLEKSTFV